MNQTTEKQNTQTNRYVKNGRTHSNTLVISGMRNDVTKNDIQRHFTGCLKITIKQSYLPPFLKYNNNYCVFSCH